MKLKSERDAYGHAVYDWSRGKGGFEIVENDLGCFAISGGPPAYFAEFEKWPAHQRAAFQNVFGARCSGASVKRRVVGLPGQPAARRAAATPQRVLDIGCGAGRVALELQRRGHAVTGIDVSPLAIRVCRERGVRDARVLPITKISARLGAFDTIVMYGNNFGLFGSRDRARRLLRRFHRLTNPGARIIAESNNPYATTNPVHLAYQRFNRRRGRMAGQLRLRVRYWTYVTPWFDYLIVSKPEMESIVAGTGWRIARYFDSPGSTYVAILERQ